MTEEEKAAEANALATAQEEARKKAEEEAKANEPTEAEKKILALEKEKEEILVRESNYKVAYLKEKKKNETPEDESEEDRIRRITREEMAQNRINAIDSEKEELLKKTLKENKELKIAIQNKVPDKPSGGAHNEHQEVISTLVTPEQIAAFKAKGWTDKDIERYKKNLLRYKS